MLVVLIQISIAGTSDVVRVVRQGSQRRAIVSRTQSSSLEHFISTALARLGGAAWDKTSQKCVIATGKAGIIYSSLDEVPTSDP